MHDSAYKGIESHSLLGEFIKYDIQLIILLTKSHPLNKISS